MSIKLLNNLVREVRGKEIILTFREGPDGDPVIIGKQEAKIFIVELNEAIQTLEREGEIGHMRHLQEVMAQGRPGSKVTA